MQYANNAATGYQTQPWNEGVNTCAIRQYSSNGRLHGYAGALELNLFYRDRTAWMRYAQPNQAIRPIASDSKIAVNI